jgi:hypothetical protein
MNARDRLTIHNLAIAVRFLSVQQLARLRECSVQTAFRLAKRLVTNGWAKRIRLLAQPIEIGAPLATWKPGLATPDATLISKAAILRYRNVPMQVVEAVTATNRTLQHFGLESRIPPKRFQQTHDLGLSETFVHFWRRWPKLTHRCWIGEDYYRSSRGRGEKVEDAQLRRPCSGETLLVVEFTGKYKATRVTEFINDVVARQLPFVCY